MSPVILSTAALFFSNFNFDLKFSSGLVYQSDVIERAYIQAIAQMYKNPKKAERFIYLLHHYEHTKNPDGTYTFFTDRPLKNLRGAYIPSNPCIQRGNGKP